jgi:hypothetical protein
LLEFQFLLIFWIPAPFAAVTMKGAVFLVLTPPASAGLLLGLFFYPEDKAISSFE